MKPLESMISLFSQMNNDGIVYCHWKSNEHLLEGLSGYTDLDILVEIPFKEQVKQIFTDYNFIRMKSQYGSSYPKVEDWIGLDFDTGKMTHIHLHYAMITGHIGLKEYTLPWSDFCLNTRIRSEIYPIYISNPNIEIITLVTRIGLKLKFEQKIKAVVDKYRIGYDDLKELEFLKKKVNWKAVESNLEIYFENDANQMMRLIQSDECNAFWIKKLDKLSNKYGKKWTHITYPINQILRAYYAFSIPFRYALKKYFNPNIITRKTFGKDNGIMVAFVGQDGAGKSTISKDVYDWLFWKTDVRKFYLGSGDHYNSFAKMIVSKLSNSNIFILKYFRSIAAIWDMRNLAKRTYLTLREAKEFSKLGGIALFDRYPQIQFAGLNDGPKIRQMLEGKNVSLIVRKFIEYNAEVEEKYLRYATDIKPDIVFKLMLPIEESMRRKPDESIEIIMKKHNIIDALEFPGSEVHIVDATQKYSCELVEIKKYIWNAIIKKIGGMKYDKF